MGLSPDLSPKSRPPHKRFGRCDCFFFAKAPELGNAYAVYLRVTVWQSEDEVQVPPSALSRQCDGWAVFSVEKRCARLKIGERNDEVAEVVSGPEPGMLVICHPSDAVPEGVRVEDAVRQ